MTRIAMLFAPLIGFAYSASAWADEAPGPGGPPFPGYGHMMWGWGRGWGDGYGPGFMFHPFMAVLALIGLVVVVMWLVRMINHGMWHRYHAMHGYGGSAGPSRALDILSERFARGEIDKAEYEEKKKLLGP